MVSVTQSKGKLKTHFRRLHNVAVLCARVRNDASRLLELREPVARAKVPVSWFNPTGTHYRQRGSFVCIRGDQKITISPGGIVHTTIAQRRIVIDIEMTPAMIGNIPAKVDSYEH